MSANTIINTIPVGDTLLGRAIDAAGAPLDGGGPLDAASQLPIDRRVGADAMPLLTGMVCRDEMFAAVLDPFDRTAEAKCRQRHQHIFRVELATYAETATDMALMKVYTGTWPA